MPSLVPPHTAGCIRPTAWPYPEDTWGPGSSGCALLGCSQCCNCGRHCQEDRGAQRYQGDLARGEWGKIYIYMSESISVLTLNPKIEASLTFNFEENNTQLTLFSSGSWETRGSRVTNRSRETRISSPAKFANRTRTTLRTCVAQFGYNNYLYCLWNTLRVVTLLHWSRLQSFQIISSTHGNLHQKNLDGCIALQVWGENAILGIF